MACVASKDKPSSMDLGHCNQTNAFTPEHSIDERYPKSGLEKMPSIIFEFPRPKLNYQSVRSRHNLRFRTQPVTLTEIYETDEENKIENDNQQESKTNLIHNYDRFGHLALAENLRQTARKKLPLKNFLIQQRLKTTQEELSETDGS